MDKNYIHDVIHKLWDDKQKWKSAAFMLKSNHPDISSSLHELYPDVDKMSTKAWLFINSLDRIPVCYCGKSLKWLDFGRGFTTFCSTKCLANSQTVINQKKETLIIRYGTDHYSKTTDYKIKFKQTCQSKYGVDNPGQISDTLSGRAYNKSQTHLKRLMDEFDGIYTPNFSPNEWHGVRKPSSWHCEKCGNDFVTNVLAYSPLVCNVCVPKTFIGSSKLELSIFDIVNSISPDAISKDRSILAGKELDIYVPSKKIAIEICGSYWHSDRFVDKFYHHNKFIECNKQGIRLLTLFDFDLTKLNVVESMIRTNLSVDKDLRIAARHGKTIQIDSNTSKDFQNIHHIRGFSVATYHIGFYYNDSIVAVSSWSKPRYSKELNTLELIRLCSSRPITGLLGKMTSAAIKLFNPDNILSYVDLRYGDGHSYIAAGYKLQSITKPGYWYVDNTGICKHRSSFTKKKLMQLNSQFFNMTEFEITDKLGYHRIWDCGHKLFKLEVIK